MLFAEIMDEAGVPTGVFNLVNGDGPGVGAALRRTPTSTWSPSPARPAPASRWRRPPPTPSSASHQELGGKSANIILDDVDLGAPSAAACSACMANTGQSCNAPTRMLVPAARTTKRRGRQRRRPKRTIVGDPRDAATHSARWSARRSSTRSRA